MQQDWKQFVGKTVGNGYPLNTFLGMRGEAAVFATHREGTVGATVVNLLLAHTAQAQRQEHSWSLAKSLPHPHLVQIHDVGHVALGESEFLYAVSERADERVADVLPERALTEEEARQVLTSILPALQHLHDHGILHGSLDAANIVATNDQVKLTSDFLYRAAELPAVQGQHKPAARFSPDMQSLGATLVEMLTQHRPTLQSAAPAESTLQGMASPFREIIAGTLVADDNQWHVDEVQRALAGLPVFTPLPSPPIASMQTPVAIERPSSPSTPPTDFTVPSQSRMNLVPVALASLVLLVVLAAWLFPWNRQQPVTPSQAAPSQVAEGAPSTANTPVLNSRTGSPPRVAEAKATSSLSGNNRLKAEQRISRKPASQWAVVAAIYNDYEGAARRAQRLRAQWKRSELTVFPPRGQGQRYMVIVGTAPSQAEAARLRQQARTAGLPRDTYVTKITTQAP